MKSNSIELHPALTWDCESCGRENILRLAVDSHSDDPGSPAAKFVEKHQKESAISARIPEYVKCSHCSASFMIDRRTPIV